MAIMMTKEDDENIDLARQINADLREKMNETTRQMANSGDPDFTEGGEYVADLKKTSRFAWIWILVGVAAVVALVVVGLNH